MTGLPCVTLPQPQPTLIGEGVVTVLALGWRAPSWLVGGRVGLHASKLDPMPGPVGAGWSVAYFGEPYLLCEGDSDAVAVPRGAIVASATLRACLPIVDYDGPTVRSGPLDTGHWDGGCVDVHGGRAIHWWHHDAGFRDVSDQLAFSSFAPGGWAWVFEDAAPTTERCPRCWDDRLAPASVGFCPACNGAGRCDPIPAKGRPRVWRWVP